MGTGPVTPTLAELSRYVIGAMTLQQTLDRVSAVALEVVPDADFVAATLVEDGRPIDGGFTDTVASTLDRAQFDHGDGPCLAAVDALEPVRIDSTRSDGRWPELNAVAVAHRVQSALCLPLLVDGAAVGALSLYSRTEYGFAEADQGSVERYAAHASIVVVNAQTYWAAANLNDRLRLAIQHRSIIEQAKGILMARQHCDADAAYGLLVRASQRENVKLRVIAQRIVHDNTLPT